MGQAPAQAACDSANGCSCWSLRRYPRLFHGAVAPGNLRGRRLANDDDETEVDREELDHHARRGSATTACKAGRTRRASSRRGPFLVFCRRLLVSRASPTSPGWSARVAIACAGAWGLPPADPRGATLMAAGASAPDLIAELIATFFVRRHERRTTRNCGWKRGVQPVDHYRRGDLGLARTEDDSRSKSINTRCGLLRRYDCGAGAGVCMHGGDRRAWTMPSCISLPVPVRDLDVHREAHFTSFLGKAQKPIGNWAARATWMLCKYPEKKKRTRGSSFPRRRKRIWKMLTCEMNHPQNLPRKRQGTAA